VDTDPNSDVLVALGVVPGIGSSVENDSLDPVPWTTTSCVMPEAIVCPFLVTGIIPALSNTGREKLSEGQAAWIPEVCESKTSVSGVDGGCTWTQLFSSAPHETFDDKFVQV